MKTKKPAPRGGSGGELSVDTYSLMSDPYTFQNASVAAATAIAIHRLVIVSSYRV
jgi:hypothetical protein